MGINASGFVIFRRINKTPEYLLLQASYGQNHWTPPKGLLDPGENSWKAALRELKEETGLCESDLNIYRGQEKIIHYNLNSSLKKVTYYVAELISANKCILLSKEHQDFKWAVLEHACDLVRYDSLQNVLKDVESFVNTC